MYSSLFLLYTYNPMLDVMEFKTKYEVIEENFVKR